MTLTREETVARLERGFNPRNVAVVGAARHNNFNWLRAHSAFQQNHGKLFHVNIDQNEWPGAEELGVPNFSSLLDIPEPIDYVTISVPRQVVPRVVQDCITKGVAVVHVYTAGFGESGEAEGIRLEQSIVEMAQKAGMPIIGPNCMGLFNPAVGIRQSAGQYHEERGYLGYISQSGSQSTGLVDEAYSHGIKVSYCISMGNGVVVDAPDLVDYLAQDEDTKVIGMYLEGVRNPYKFFQSLREAVKRKPVIIWKVGQTEDAARATEAHTGTSYVRRELWDAVVTRCGAVQVDNMAEMIDTAKALSVVPPAIGVKIGLFALSGGHSTEMANVFSKSGFKVVPFSERSNEELASFLSLIGGNYVNPIQVGGENFDRIVDVLSRDENIDVVAVEVSTGRLHQNPEMMEGRIKAFKAFQASSAKPIIAVLSSLLPKTDSTTLESVERRFSQEGIPAFLGFERGARALKNVVDYHSQRVFLGE